VLLSESDRDVMPPIPCTDGAFANLLEFAILMREPWISERVVAGVAGSETRYFIGSMSGTAKGYLRWVRGHWGIENSLHWILDVCFREDDQRHRAENSAENLSWLRKLALCLLKAEKNSKGKSIHTRRLLAGWKNDYLLSVLAQIPGNSGA
jgi:hypothetical protein